MQSRFTGCESGILFRCIHIETTHSTVACFDDVLTYLRYESIFHQKTELIAKFSSEGEQSDQHFSGDARTGATSSNETPTKGIAYPEILNDWSVVCNLAEATSYRTV